MTFIFLKMDLVKTTVYLGDGDIWSQLVELFSNLGLHVSEKLLTVEPARAILATKQYFKTA